MIDMTSAPLLIADSRALDFLNSLAVPVEKEVDWLANGEQLLAWLEAAGLVEPAALDEVRSSASPGELDAVASHARGLREWLREFVARHRGKPLTRSVLKELEPLNILLARDEQFTQIALRPKDEEHESALELVRQRRWRAADALLFPVAEAIAHLVADADFTYVKQCEGPACILHFLDTSRDRRRRWCCMAVCGNRAKQAAYRSRKAAVR